VKPRTSTIAICIAAIYCLVDATEVFAWGPATHVHLGSQVLGHLALLPAAVAALLARHRLDYLYGNVAADVVFAKRWSRVKQFCHHWTTGFQLHDLAEDDRGRAFALGYLSHLAADTVAHGKFVPRQLAVTRSTVNFGHLYWEMRADNRIALSAFRQLDALAGHDVQPHHDLMSDVITETFLPYDLNLHLFKRINRLVTRQHWRRSVSLWGQYSRWPLCADLLERYHHESMDRIMSVLQLRERSPVLHEDPNGTSALLSVKVNRRSLHRLRRRGLPLDHLLREAAASYAPQPVPRPAPPAIVVPS
jgi:hypothetical protein